MRVCAVSAFGIEVGIYSVYDCHHRPPYVSKTLNGVGIFSVSMFSKRSATICHDPLHFQALEFGSAVYVWTSRIMQYLSSSWQKMKRPEVKPPLNMLTSFFMPYHYSNDQISAGCHEIPTLIVYWDYIVTHLKKKK